jgi:hypothetical protein
MLGLEPRDLKQHPPPALNPFQAPLETHPGIDQLIRWLRAHLLAQQTFAAFVSLKVAVQAPPIGDDDLCY